MPTSHNGNLRQELRIVLKGATKEARREVTNASDNRDDWQLHPRLEAHHSTQQILLLRPSARAAAIPGPNDGDGLEAVRVQGQPPRRMRDHLPAGAEFDPAQGHGSRPACTGATGLTRHRRRSATHRPRRLRSGKSEDCPALIATSFERPIQRQMFSPRVRSTTEREQSTDTARDWMRWYIPWRRSFRTKPS